MRRAKGKAALVVLSGTASRLVLLTVMMVGRIMMPSSTAAVNRLMPLPLLTWSTVLKNGDLTMACTAGTSTIMPKKP